MCSCFFVLDLQDYKLLNICLVPFHSLLCTTESCSPFILSDWLSFPIITSGGNGSTKVLAKDSQSQGGDVSQWAGGDPGCHRALWVRKSAGASLQTAGQVCVQPSLPGNWQPYLQKSAISGAVVVGVCIYSLPRCFVFCRWQRELCITGTTSTSWVWSATTQRRSCRSCSRLCTATLRPTGTSKLLSCLHTSY